MPGETTADLLTQQFYDWEVRGRGWTVWNSPVTLEPPFRPFGEHYVPRAQIDDGLRETGASLLTKGLLSLFTPPPKSRRVVREEPEVEEPGPEYLEELEERVELLIALPPKSEPNPQVFTQCLQGLSGCREALSFEIVGTSEGIVTVVTASLDDVEFVFGQLKAHFPDAVITASQSTLTEAFESVPQASASIREFGLAVEFMIPIRTRREMAADPLVALCGVFEHLSAGEAGVFQVLFQPVRAPWVASMRSAVLASDGSPFFANAPELVALTRDKTAAPLYAAVIRVAARSCEPGRAGSLVRQLTGVMRLFAAPDGNALQMLDNKDYPEDAHLEDLMNRTTHRNGVLLNSEELVSLIHLPSSAVRSRKLLRETEHTKPAPDCLLGNGLVLGDNTHEGRTVRPALNVEHRVRHLHLVGASGTGKSTLLLNLICQDIYQGNGVAVIDPHGDLVDQIAAYIPPERFSDTILIDPADSEFPIALNLLSAHTDEEKNLLASDLVAIFRRLSTSWGDQMNSVLGNAILAFLESTRGGTLAELRRFLIEPGFRKEFLAGVTDPEVVYYWQKEFPLLKGGSLGSLMTRLDTFLRPKSIRYMVAQKENKIDFGEVMQEGRIVLVKLSQGLIGEENAGLLGSVLVSKFHQLAIARQSMARTERRPFFLYLDEFQHFISPSMEAILSGARKYGLGLVLAHQDLRQLSRDVELSASVLANCATRICFRVGDADAEKLAGGFAEFDADDLRRLGTGQAICRVERADHDFNIKTQPAPEVDEDTAVDRRNHLRDLSRHRYGTPRSEVEAELAASRIHVSEERVDPFTSRTARKEPPPPKAPPQEDPAPVAPSRVSKPPVPAPPPLPRAKPPISFSGELVPKLGNAELREHRKLQHRVAMVGQQRGWRSLIEASLGEHGNVDVLLSKDEFHVACEVALSSPPDYEVQSIGKRLDAGINLVVVIGVDPAHLEKIEALTRKVFGPDYGHRVRFGNAEVVGDLLDEIDAQSSGGEEVIGEMNVRYQAKVVAPEDKGRRQDILKTALKRLKAGGRRSRS